MSMNDLLSDMFSRIRNGYSARHLKVKVKKSKISLGVLDLLYREGYIRGYKFLKEEPYNIEVLLKYHLDTSVIKGIQRVSRPGKRIYSSASNLKLVHNGLGTLIVSTSLGILSAKEAQLLNIGGEVLGYTF